MTNTENAKNNPLKKSKKLLEEYKNLDKEIKKLEIKISNLMKRLGIPQRNSPR